MAQSLYNAAKQGDRKGGKLQLEERIYKGAACTGVEMGEGGWLKGDVSRSLEECICKGNSQLRQGSTGL